jgi:hypothetical protein
LIFFFSALAGIGYVDPESVAAAPVADFQPGSPVYNREESVISHGKKADEQKELERSWQRKKRPKDVSDQCHKVQNADRLTHPAF